MADYYFERECRTPYSEAYHIYEDDTSIGRLDMHFTREMVHATLCVNESLTREAIEEVIQAIDEELLDAVGIPQEELIVHVFQGRDAGLYSNDAFEDDDHDHEVEDEEEV
ncbi:MAG: hypothetical protein HY532_00245 [Chloroflexi bacterium]|nr:hypothetical protein [Chloroflexota bacterium]